MLCELGFRMRFQFNYREWNYRELIIENFYYKDCEVFSLWKFSYSSKCLGHLIIINLVNVRVKY